jgi:transcriptional regulator with XRE-family HTH domain
MPAPCRLPPLPAAPNQTAHVRVRMASTLRYQRVIQARTGGPDSGLVADAVRSPDHGARTHQMTSQNGRAFNEWLRAQLKAKKMSQRQLAQQSGVDHSTISRLIRGDRMPSLGTATKLARGLRELRDDADAPAYLGLVSSAAPNPTARVEYALRSDDMLTEPQVRQIMEYYLAVRMRRFGRAFQSGDTPTRPNGAGLGREPGGGTSGNLASSNAHVAAGRAPLVAGSTVGTVATSISRSVTGSGPTPRFGNSRQTRPSGRS